ncbi:hypothetical protein F7725_010896 [Dissostichus mawsoni]|uniref:Histidine N-acetyltransferase C-terminal domain-containing protein n=1 Tax=Dissostichus mawsoni TaxID=36200 RepID=A0A7J5Z7F3_DISMA|nr:hypothetical protein F7725_010896 [Dissostichus mawsoni]
MNVPFPVSAPARRIPTGPSGDESVLQGSSFRLQYSLNINMFGKELDHVQQQFLCHLQRHTATLKGDVMCQMFLDPPLWKPMMEFCRNILNVELVKEYTKQCVVESDVI